MNLEFTHLEFYLHMGTKYVMDGQKIQIVVRFIYLKHSELQCYYAVLHIEFPTYCLERRISDTSRVKDWGCFVDKMVSIIPTFYLHYFLEMRHSATAGLAFAKLEDIDISLNPIQSILISALARLWLPHTKWCCRTALSLLPSLPHRRCQNILGGAPVQG